MNERFGRCLVRCAALLVVVLWHGSQGLTGWAQDERPPQDKFTDQDLEFFEREIRPLFAAHCFECHGPDEQEASLRLDHREALLTGGDSGPAIKPYQPAESLLLQVVEYDGDIQMPPDSKLPAAKIKLIEEWIKRGAPWPTEDNTTSAAGKEQFDIAARVAAHWSWHAPSRPDIPETTLSDWGRDPIDKFILQRLEQARLTPAADADKATLIRRLYFDLIGLPPRPEDVEAFLGDTSPQAVEKVVDRLLASPRFGEHWARKWMDLVRYAETHGHEYDYPIEHAYQYRDYLIRAFNADVPYSQFILEHIAGDLMPEPRRHPERHFNESVLGTGFWFLGEATHGPVDVREDEAGHIENRIDIVGKAILGLTVACARCHDHKFDAISTADYYALSGFLQSSRKQTVLIDLDRTIEKTLDEANGLRAAADEQFARWLREFHATDEATLAQRWGTIIRALRDYPRPTGQPLTLQGEDLQVQPTSQKVAMQRLEPQDQFAWQGNEQIWWRDGKPGDRIALEFQVPEAGMYRVGMNLTMAPDYGIVKMWLDDAESQAKTFDGYAPRLTTSGMIELYRGELSPGKHVMHVAITGKHPAAIAMHMFGLDYLRLDPIVREGDVEQWSAAISRSADGGGQSPEVWKRLASALVEHPIESPEHPLFILARLVHRDVDAAALAEHADALDAKSAAVPQSDEQVFTDFETHDASWFATGWAFAGNPHAGISLLHDGAIAAGVATSERWGPAVQGSYRSPTFEITHDKIHYRIRGENVQIRVIIDGFALDHFNPLLFNGMTFQLAKSPEFTWVTQSGDLKNYKGHRAYIEINDLGEGWCVLDKIIFSNGATPSEPPHSLNQALARTLPTSDPDQIAQAVAQWISERRSERPEAPELVALIDWISRHELQNLFVTNAVSSAAGVMDWHSPLSEMRRLTARLPDPPKAIGMTDGTPEDEYVFIRGNHRLRGPTVPRQNLTALLKDPERYRNLNTSGRWEFATDLVQPNHPLTSRVIVNRLWYHMFGEGIVRTVDNFGVLGSPPTHPELLDYLALEFVEDGWSIKRMLRRLALTRTYQMSTRATEEAKAADPSNQLWHAARVRRLTGEEIRDAILSVSGELNTKMHGPSVPIYLTEFMQGRGRPAQSGPLDGAGRRSVYLEVRRNFLNPMMLAFDTPIPFNAIGRRNVSNVPAQALILMNDPFVIDQAAKWAKRVMATEPNRRKRIEAMVYAALGRPATTEEIRLCESFIRDESQSRKLSAAQADQNESLWRDLGHVIFNMKSFTYLF